MSKLNIYKKYVSKYETWLETARQHKVTIDSLVKHLLLEYTIFLHFSLASKQTSRNAHFGHGCIFDNACATSATL